MQTVSQGSAFHVYYLCIVLQCMTRTTCRREAWRRCTTCGDWQVGSWKLSLRKLAWSRHAHLSTCCHGNVILSIQWCGDLIVDNDSNNDIERHNLRFFTIFFLCCKLFSICALKWFVCLFVGCLTSQQHASVSQGWICSDNYICFDTEIEVADSTFHLTQSQYTDTRPTSPSTDPIMPGACQGSHWSANF